LLYIFR